MRSDREIERVLPPGFYGYRSLHTRSHGEAFLAVVQNRMKQESFFLLDEPEAALSPSPAR